MTFVGAAIGVECRLEQIPNAAPEDSVSIGNVGHCVLSPANHTVVGAPLPAVGFDRDRRGSYRSAPLRSAAKHDESGAPGFIAIRINLRVGSKRPANAPDPQVAVWIVVNGSRGVADAIPVEEVAHCAANVPGGDEIFR